MICADTCGSSSVPNRNYLQHSPLVLGHEQERTLQPSTPQTSSNTDDTDSSPFVSALHVSSQTQSSALSKTTCLKHVARLLLHVICLVKHTIARRAGRQGHSGPGCAAAKPAAPPTPACKLQRCSPCPGPAKRRLACCASAPPAPPPRRASTRACSTLHGWYLASVLV